jgi:hypothetical protein
MASLNDFDGVDEAIQQQQGAVFNEPAPFVLPNSQQASPVIDSGGQLPPGASVQETATQAPTSPYEVANPEVGDATLFSERNPWTGQVSGTAGRQEIVRNPLHDYEDYTYNLSLHAITTEQYNNLAENPDGYVPQNVLIAGAGKYSETFQRNINFREDFYFDELKFTTIVNTTTRSKFSNVFDIMFKIIEPNGFTLIQRLINACEGPPSEGGLGGLNYLKQPFILQIDFYAQNVLTQDSRDLLDAADVYGVGGAPNLRQGGLIPDMTKFIPIRLVAMKTRIGVNGTEYSIEAQPFNHVAFEPTHITLPAAFTIKAATVQDIFQNSNVDQGVVDAETQRYRTEQEEIERLQTYANLADAFGPGTQSQEVPKTTTVLGQYGVAAGYNSWYRTLQRKSFNGVTYKPNFIKFVIDSELANSAIYADGPNDVSNAASRDDSKDNARQAGGLNVGQIQWNSGTVTMPAGTSIQNIVKWAISNSDYMRKQLLGVATGNANANRTTQLQEALKLVRIIPSVKVLSYDQSRQDFQYEITYIIRKYLMNTRSPLAPQGRVAGYVKEYNWIYTGGQSPYTGDNLSNRDVIDLQLDFNMLFYTTLTAFKESSKLFNTGTFIGDESSLAVEASGFEGDPNNPKPVIPSQESPADYGVQDRIARSAAYYVSADPDGKRTGSQQRSVYAASDVINNTILDARGDMINVKLSILGDPQFIKQDDVFYNLGVANKTSLFTPNNSFWMDDGELYVLVNFRSPVDYDESTGLAIPYLNKYSYSEFTGVYKIITISNTFTKGKFTQVLDLVRLSIQDSKRVLEIQQAYRQTYNQEIGQGQIARFPATSALGQRIAGTVFSGGLLQGGAGDIVNSLAGKFISESAGRITSEVAGLVEDIGTDLIEGVGDIVTDIGQQLGIIDNVTDVIDFELGDPTVLAGVPEVDWTGFGDVVGW